jgi:hypothetical protein
MKAEKRILTARRAAAGRNSAGKRRGLLLAACLLAAVSLGSCVTKAKYAPTKESKEKFTIEFAQEEGK